MSRLTPSSSNITRPGFTTATHISGDPLPLPMRVSAGFFVIGLSGEIRIHTFPPPLIWCARAPPLPASLDVARQRPTRSLDLAAGHPARLERLQAVGPERHRVATLAQA